MTLLLPTDRCPRCVPAVTVHPDDLTEFPELPGVAAFYRCPVCGHDWWTGWGLDAADLPCPGCPACRNEKGDEVA